MTEKPKIKLPHGYERIVINGQELKCWGNRIVQPVHVSYDYWLRDDGSLPMSTKATYKEQTYVDTGVVDNLGRRVFERDPVEFMAERLLQ